MEVLTGNQKDSKQSHMTTCSTPIGYFHMDIATTINTTTVCSQVAVLQKEVTIGRFYLDMELTTVNDRISPRGLICQNDFLRSIFKV